MKVEHLNCFGVLVIFSHSFVIVFTVVMNFAWINIKIIIYPNWISKQHIVWATCLSIPFQTQTTKLKSLFTSLIFWIEKRTDWNSNSEHYSNAEQTNCRGSVSNLHFKLKVDAWNRNISIRIQTFPISHLAMDMTKHINFLLIFEYGRCR